jgi:hypothetical protein
MVKHNQSSQQQNKNEDRFTKITIQKWQKHNQSHAQQNKSKDEFTKTTISNPKTQSILSTTEQN